MTLCAQTFHVFQKDVRHLKWMLLAYLVLVLFGLAGSAEWMQINVEVTPPIEYLIIFVAALIVAVLIQAESPTQNDSFWVTRPLDWRAVIGAKLLFSASLLVGLPLAAQVVVLMLWDVPIGAFPTMLYSPLGIYAIALVPSLILAALTRDLKGYVVGWVLILVGLVGAGELLNKLAIPTLPQLSMPWLGVVALALFVPVGTSLLLYIYKIRNSRSSAAWSVGAGVLIMVMAPLLPRPKNGLYVIERAAGQHEEVNFLVAGDSVEPRLNGDAGGNLRLHLVRRTVGDSLGHVGSLADTASIITFVLDSAWLSGGGGGADGGRIEARYQAAVLQYPRTVPVGFDAEWLGEPLPTDGQAALFLRFDGLAYQSANRGGAGVAIGGTLHKRRPVPVGALDLRVGSSVTFGGKRVTVRELDEGARAPNIVVELSLIDWNRSSSRWEPRLHHWSVLGYALVNERLKQAVMLRDFRAAPNGSSATVMFVEKTVSHFELRARFPANSGQALSADFLSDAKLIVYDFETLATQPVSMTLPAKHP